MLALIFAILVGIVFTYFALQNTQTVTLQLQNYAATIPLYVVAVLSMILGIVIAFVINLADSISSSFTIFSKNRKIKNTENSLARLENKIHDLEIENARLKGSKNESILKQSAFAKPNLVQKIRHNLSV